MLFQSFLRSIKEIVLSILNLHLCSFNGRFRSINEINSSISKEMSNVYLEAVHMEVS